MARDAGFGRWVGGLQFGDGGGDAVWVGGGDGDSCAEFEAGFCDAVADSWAVLEHCFGKTRDCFGTNPTSRR